MKNLVITLLVLCWSVNGFSQRFVIDGVASFKGPKSTSRLTEEQRHALASERTFVGEIINRQKGFDFNYFIVESILVNLNASQGIVIKNYLQQIKSGFDDMTRMTTGSPGKGYSSQIKKINGNEVLIIHDKHQDYSFFSFFVVNSQRNKTLAGGLYYDPSDPEARASAEKAVYQILRSLRFK